MKQDQTDQTESDRIRQDQTESDRIRQDQTGSDRIRQNETESDRTKQDDLYLTSKYNSLSQIMSSEIQKSCITELH